MSCLTVFAPWWYRLMFLAGCWKRLRRQGLLSWCCLLFPRFLVSPPQEKRKALTQNLGLFSSNSFSQSRFHPFSPLRLRYFLLDLNKNVPCNRLWSKIATTKASNKYYLERVPVGYATHPKRINARPTKKVWEKKRPQSGTLVGSSIPPWAAP